MSEPLIISAPTVLVIAPTGAQGPANGGPGGGTDGNDGWSPILAAVSDGGRRVLQVVDWTGGEGTKPATGSFIGPSGLVGSAAAAVDIRGATGADGPTGPTGAQGPTGATGPQGSQGATGAQGPAGVDGERWHAAGGTPGGGLGVIGDWFLNTSNGDVYEKTGAATWTLSANIKGPQGDTGPTGATGATGAQGPTGATGATGATGPQGPAGPNTVSTSTGTDINGILKGNGTVVAQAVANTDYAAAAHASRHQSGGADSIKLDALALPDDNTNLDASTTRHGLMPKFPGGTTNFLRADGTFAAPSGGGNEYVIFGQQTVIALSPADSTTYFAATTNLRTGYTDASIIIPFTGTVVGYYVRVAVTGTAGSGEDVNYYLRHNNTTDFGNVVDDWDGYSDVASGALSQAVTAGDTIALKIVTPAWVTNPTNVYVNFHIKLQVA